MQSQAHPHSGQNPGNRKTARRFAVSPNYRALLSDMQIDIETVLGYAGLPADLFNRNNSSLTPEEYFLLWNGIEQAAGTQELPLLLAQHLTAEAFDPPIFASLCSPNLNTAVSRLQQYKPLIGPMMLDVDIGQSRTRLVIDCYHTAESIPRSLGLGELVFFTQLARIGTRQRITPKSLSVIDTPDDPAPYEAYFGCSLKAADQVSISFASDDAALPFLTANNAMWQFFEGDLNRKLADLDAGASTTERVRAVLLEALPAGDCSIESVASRLAMSKRTLQRKLTAEAESYQSVLQAVRAELADHYLERSAISLGEISFLLGFREANSFIRAYTGWKGMPPGQFREQMRQ